jgi:hypothetical protein
MMKVSESIRNFALAKGHFDSMALPGVESGILFAFGDNTTFSDKWMRAFDGELVANPITEITARTFALFVAEALES